MKKYPDHARKQAVRYKFTSTIQRFDYHSALLTRLQQVHPYLRKHVVQFMLFCALLSGIVVTLLGIIGVQAWVRTLPSFMNAGPFPLMKTNSAICFVFLGIGLLLVLFGDRKPLHVIRFVLVLLVLTIGLLTLVEYIFSLNLGIDQLFFTEIPTALGPVFPNRMSPNSALLFVLAGISLIGINWKVSGKYVHQIACLTGLFILMPTIIGHLYSIDFIFGAATSTKMSVQTAMGFLFFFGGVILSKPEYGFMHIVVSRSAGGYIARRLVITAIMIPLFLGWIIITGYTLELYDAQFEYLLFITAIIIIFSLVIWRNAISLHQIDSQRRMSELNILYLAEASKILSSSLDYRTTLNKIAALGVLRTADLCSVEMKKIRTIEQLAIAHRDKTKLPLVRQLRKLYPPTEKENSRIASVIKTGKPLLLPIITDRQLAKNALNREQLNLLRKLKICSLMIVPINFQQKTLGAITFISSNSNRIYGPADLAMAEELANRAALAIQNAKLYANAKAAIALRDDFISIASHELKTPITSLKVYLQLLARYATDEKSYQYYDKINQQVDKLTLLIRDLLDVSRLQTGRLELRREVFNLAAVVEEMVENIRQTETRHDISVTGNILKMVEGDKDRIGQVVTNLLTNAVKYSPDANRILVTLEEQYPYATVKVQDFGIGIEKKYFNKIFQRFYRIEEKNEKTFPGLGIGLYISQEIIKRHGGFMEVSSELGKGSVFSFSLSLNYSHSKTGKREPYIFIDSRK